MPNTVPSGLVSPNLRAGRTAWEPSTREEVDPPMRRTAAFLAAVVLGALALPAVAAPDGSTKQRGEFTTLPDGAAMGLTVEGFAQITRSEDGTVVKARVRGLEP